jgi:phosphatidylinositol-3-phosphatase
VATGLGVGPLVQGATPAGAAASAAGASTDSHGPTKAALRTARTMKKKGPCGTMALSSTAYTHVVWIWMENHSSSTIIGSLQAPYINSLATSCGLAANYHNISHPSLPNYLAGTSGLSLTAIQPFTSDCAPSSSCSTSTPSVFGQGETWKAYEDAMPSNCHTSDAGPYAVRHNPPAYYTTLHGCSSFDVPIGQLSTDLKSGTLPAFSFVTPDVINDMHDGSVAQGNAWLAKTVKRIVKSTGYRTGKVVLFVTWDEGEGGSSDNCATNTADVGCHVATIVVSPSTPAGVTSSTLFNHYSLLMTTEQLLGLPLLGSASTATSMKAAFGL